MVRKYKPVEVKAIQWARLLKMIQENPKGVAVYDLAEELGIGKGDESLEKGLRQLMEQRKIKWVIGRSKKGLTCRVVTAVGDHPSGGKDILFGGSGGPRTTARTSPE